MFRFTIRDLLWLMVVMALSLGWSLDHLRASAMREAWEGCELLSTFVSDHFEYLNRDNGGWHWKLKDSVPRESPTKSGGVITVP